MDIKHKLIKTIGKYKIIYVPIFDWYKIINIQKKKPYKTITYFDNLKEAKRFCCQD